MVDVISVMPKNDEWVVKRSAFSKDLYLTKWLVGIKRKEVVSYTFSK